MKKVKLVLRRMEFYLMARPRLLVVVVCLVFLGLLTVFEVFRANLYKNSVTDYKNSVLVLETVDTSDRITNSALTTMSASLCDISLSQSTEIGGVNEAYATVSSDDDELLNQLSSNIAKINPPPAFNSFLQFVPSVREARIISVDVHQAVTELSRLSRDDVRVEYCIALQEALADVYFLSNVGTPQGVSALIVGQLENFQVNVNQVHERLLLIDPPKVFYDNHISIIDSMNSIAISLRENENDFESFSRKIEKYVESIDESLLDIKDNTDDLQTKPVDISIQANYLRVDSENQVAED